MTPATALEIDVYGIANCDTVRKARAWLTAQGQTHRFHDYKTQGVSPEQLQRWARALGWQTLANRKSSTWRALTDAQRLASSQDSELEPLLLAHVSLIKRPTVEWGWRSGAEPQIARISSGFDPKVWAELLAQLPSTASTNFTK
jgi:arsenate reductase (glutaredoxin)